MLLTKRVHQCTIFQALKAVVKVDPIPHVMFETTKSGFIRILHHCSVSWKITTLYFNSNLVYFGICTFDRLLLLKIYKISAKKVQRSYVSWHWRMMQNLKKMQVMENLKKSWLAVWKHQNTWKCQNWYFHEIL